VAAIASLLQTRGVAIWSFPHIIVIARALRRRALAITFEIASSLRSSQWQPLCHCWYG